MQHLTRDVVRSCHGTEDLDLGAIRRLQNSGCHDKSLKGNMVSCAGWDHGHFSTGVHHDLLSAVGVYMHNNQEHR